MTRARWPKEAQVVSIGEHVFDLVGVDLDRWGSLILIGSGGWLMPGRPHFLTPLTPQARAMLALARGRG